MSWIPVRLDLHDDPAVVAISKRTDLDIFSVVGRLVKIWAVANQQSVDGFLAHFDEADVDRIAGKIGFAAAMQMVCWLVLCTDGVRFPNWNHWLSKSAKARLLDNRRKKNIRLLSGCSREQFRTTEQNNTEQNKTAMHACMRADFNKTSADESQPTIQGTGTMPTGEEKFEADGVLRSELERRGLAAQTAKRLVQSADPALIREVLEFHARKCSTLKKPAASLRSMIERPEKWFFARGSDGVWLAPRDDRSESVEEMVERVAAEMSRKK